MSCNTCQSLSQQLKNAEKEIERLKGEKENLKDENESLWFMLEELKDADKAMMENLSEVILKGLTPTAEA